MKKNHVTEILKKIAIKEGVTVAEVRTEIAKVIDIGFSNPNPKIRAIWTNMTPTGRKPTPEEAIIYLAEEEQRRQQNHISI